MSAPIAFNKSAKSSISGSIATLVSLVWPSANEAAIIMFSVPVTVTPSNLMFAPFNRPAVASIYPFSRFIDAPNCSNASR